MIQPVHTDQATGQQIVFPAPRWTVKRVPGNTSLVIIDPTGDTLRIPDEVAEHLANAILTIRNHAQQPAA